MFCSSGRATKISEKLTSVQQLIPIIHREENILILLNTVQFSAQREARLINGHATLLQDVIVHVRDISHPDTSAQKVNVLRTLRELGVPQPLFDGIIEVCNKADLLPAPPHEQCVSHLAIDILLNNSHCYIYAYIYITGMADLSDTSRWWFNCVCV